MKRRRWMRGITAAALVGMVGGSVAVSAEEQEERVLCGPELVIDRLEAGGAVIEGGLRSGGAQLLIPRAMLPNGIREGDVIQFQSLPRARLEREVQAEARIRRLRKSRAL